MDFEELNVNEGLYFNCKLASQGVFNTRTTTTGQNDGFYNFIL